MSVTQTVTIEHIPVPASTSSSGPEPSSTHIPTAEPTNSTAFGINLTSLGSSKDILSEALDHLAGIYGTYYENSDVLSLRLIDWIDPIIKKDVNKVNFENNDFLKFIVDKIKTLKRDILYNPLNPLQMLVSPQIDDRDFIWEGRFLDLYRAGNFNHPFDMQTPIGPTKIHEFADHVLKWLHPFVPTQLDTDAVVPPITEREIKYILDNGVLFSHNSLASTYQEINELWLQERNTHVDCIVTDQRRQVKREETIRILNQYMESTNQHFERSNQRFNELEQASQARHDAVKGEVDDLNNQVKNLAEENEQHKKNLTELGHAFRAVVMRVQQAEAEAAHFKRNKDCAIL